MPHPYAEPGTNEDSMPLVVLPLLLAIGALAGSLWLSLGMNLKACPLCLYQRTFVMGVVGVLGVGVLTGQRYRGVLNHLALPLTIAAVGVAGFHVFLEQTGKLECPAGILGVGTAPQQSLALLTVLLIAVAGGVFGSGNAATAASFGGVLLGGLFAWGSIASAPPGLPIPTKAYETPLEMCRPPYEAN